MLNLATPGGMPDAYYDYDEYGNPTSGTAGRYGWLGGKQRSTEALGGVALMGVRFYSPARGRFLSTDPVDGGSCNRYEYTCSDPVNKLDLDGRAICINLGPFIKKCYFQGDNSRPSGVSSVPVQAAESFKNRWFQRALSWSNAYSRFQRRFESWGTTCLAGAGIVAGADTVKNKGKMKGKAGWTAAAGCVGAVATRFARGRGWL